MTELVLKLILIGDGNVGKTCLINRFCYNRFNADTSMTIGVNFNVVNFDGQGNAGPAHITLSIWDLGGQGKFYSLIPYFSEGASGIVYAFDLTDKTGRSLQNLQEKWRPLIVSHLGSEIPAMLVGTKSDLIQKKNTNFSDQMIQNVCNEMGCLEYIPTSAKDDSNCERVFANLTQAILNKPIHRQKGIKNLKRITMDVD